MSTQSITLRLLAALLIITLIIPTALYLGTPLAGAVETHTWNSTADFNEGTVSNATTTNDTIKLSLENTPTTDTTKDDFRLGNNLYDGFQMTALTDDGGVVLNQGYVYNSLTNPSSGSLTSYLYHAFLDETRNLLYISSINNALYVINTQGTVDPGDDTLITRYYTGSTPALATDTAYHSFLDNSRNLLYVSTHGGGLSVINTQGTVSPADDTLVTRYYTGSTPALSDNNIWHSFLDSSRNLLYLSSGWTGGVHVINTQGTVDPGDDTLVTRYYTGSTPAIASDSVAHAFLDDIRNLLYVSTYDGGLSVINTQGTIDPGDDTLVTTYSTGSTPALATDVVYHTFLDDIRNLLYVSTFGGGLSVINTQGTVSPADDTLVTRYYTGSTPALSDDKIFVSFYDELTDRLYISGFNGITIINTQGTVDPGDDALATTYDTGSVPKIVGTPWTSFLEGDLLYGVTTSGLSVIDLSGEYTDTGIFLGEARRITDVPTTTLVYTAETTADHDVSLQYRTGSADAVWRDDFATTSSYAGDLFGWGSDIQSATVADGVLSLSEPVDGSYMVVWMDADKPPASFPTGYFPAGSKITARVRMNSSDPARLGELSLFTDDWRDGEDYTNVTNEWLTMSYVANLPFSTVGFYFNYSDYLSWNPSDSFQIDWIQIESADSLGEWNAWSSACTTPDGCTIDPSDLTGNEWIQYRMNLQTEDPLTTPTVLDVSYTDGYATTGTYTSESVTIAPGTEPRSFSADVTTPVGTTANFSYSTDEGSTWTTMNADTTFSGLSATSFMWRAVLTSSDPALTPTIASVTFTSASRESETSGSISVSKRVANLESQGRHVEAAALRLKYPDRYTDSEARELDVTWVMLGLAQEAVLKLELLMRLQKRR